MLGKILNDRWVPNNPLTPDDPLIHDERQGGVCRAVSGKVLVDHWVPNDALASNDPLISDKHQGKACHVMSGKVPDNR